MSESRLSIIVRGNSLFLVLLVSFLLPKSALAIAPLVAMNAASQVMDIGGKIAGMFGKGDSGALAFMGELQGILGGGEELGEELGMDRDPTEESRRLQDRLDAMDRAMREAEYQREDMDRFLGDDRRHVTSISDHLRYAAKAARIGKNLLRLFSKNASSTAQASQIQMVKLETQSVELQNRAYTLELEKELFEKQERLRIARSWQGAMVEDQKYRLELSRRNNRARGGT